MTSEAGVHFFNGLTGTKERFLPLKVNCINWYCCGDFHTNIDLNVVRSYIHLDIIRRVLQDYFNYDV
ncbi:unnamed protein product [Adineta steineri]|uniref:Uncharacterized protein n=1 Tax=Adineta steineri TaxID=433720 RepID=A0A818U4T4_9BILA|nr:unnamed protein product [Adineta steineri]CAF3502897.1 unnamed protein product [Adineta steineri]CAF3688100.1 unnamed protein product [Adineta steineri]